MEMKDFILLVSFAAIAILGYYIMVKLDHFLNEIRWMDEEQAQTTCFNIATPKKNPQHKKVLWKGSDNQSLVLHFIHQLCGQRS